jgi:hypothetical protein
MSKFISSRMMLGLGLLCLFPIALTVAKAVGGDRLPWRNQASQANIPIAQLSTASPTPSAQPFASAQVSDSASTSPSTALPMAISLEDNIVFFLTVPDKNLNLPAYGGRLKLYDAHMAKMFEQYSGHLFERKRVKIDKKRSIR